MLMIRSGARLAHMMGFLSGVGALSIQVIRADGRVEDYGLVGMRVITDAGVAFLADDWLDNSQDITNMNFHDSGTGGTAEATADTDLVTPAGPTTRATGTKSQPSANVLRSVATIDYSATLAIVEHGLFSQSARGGSSVMWDRTVFASIGVEDGDSIKFTYDCTLTAGG